MQYIDIHENQIYIRLAVTDSQDLKLLHFSALPLHEEDLVKEAIPEGFPFLSMNLAGFDRPYERHGNKFIVTAPGYRMKYLSHSDERNEFGRLLTFPELGMELVQEPSIQRSSNHLHISNTGNWSAKEYLPMAYLENTEVHTGLFWEIDHNGSWHWEIGDQNGHFYLALGGPNETYSHWFKDLKPGESFTTVPAAVGVTGIGFDDAMGTLTDYRRKIRRKNQDNEKLPVIFNDYMNCLWGRPTAAEEYPLVDAAAEAGCEYFCIDAGWYADGDWWDSVGEWEESRKRFPEGVKKVTDYIRSKGLVPGVWLEPEVMGIRCDLAKKLPDDWFFVRHGKRVYDRSRFQLDYRNPAVRAHMDEVVDRLVSEYGVGYIKTDYNIEPGIGTELSADSVGEGMLEHERAYISWLDGLFKRHPELIIENCSSGGLRMDYGMLSRCSIQSTSDQENYLQYAVIAANAPTGVTPEQAAVWAYPMNHEESISPDALREEVIFNMVSAMLLRIHQSGHLAKLDEERKALVKQALSVYKTIRPDIRVSRPFWPLGLAGYSDEIVSLGLFVEGKAYLAVWKRSGAAESVTLPISDAVRTALDSEKIALSCIYPGPETAEASYDPLEKAVKVALPKPVMARLFELTPDR